MKLRCISYMHALARIALTAIVICALALAVPITYNTPAYQSAFADEVENTTAPKVVKVGYVNQKGLLTKNSEGMLTGYNYDYLMNIAQFTGWKYEFIEAPGETENERLSNLLTMLDKGEVDIEGGLVYSDALAKLYEYPQNSYGTTHTSLFIPNSGASITRTDLYTRGTLRIAVPEAAKQRREELVDFCTTNGITLEMIDCVSLEEMKEKTKAGEADAFLGVDINVNEGFSIAVSFIGRPFFFAAPKGQRAIIDEIDQTIIRINESSPTLQTTLYDKYFNEYVSDFSLTNDELEFARQRETLRVGIISERAPLQSFDGQTGRLKGVTKGILDYLSVHAGLSFEVVRIERSDNPAEALRNADVDIVAGVIEGSAQIEAFGLSLTSPYMTTASLLVYNKYVDPNSLDEKILALPWDMKDSYEDNGNVKLYDSLEACFKAVNSGEADFTYGTASMSSYYQGVDNLKNLLTLPVSANSTGISLGMVQPVEPELLVILNKSINSLTVAERDALVYGNSLISGNEQVASFVRDHLLEFAIGCIMVLALIIVSLALFQRSRLKAARITREDNARFQQLYSLANEQFFEYSIESDTLRISKSGTSIASLQSDEDDDSPYLIIHNARERLQAIESPEILDAFTSPTDIVTEALCPEADGSERWLRVMSHFVTDANDHPTSVIGKIANIDDEMQEKMDLSERAYHDGLTGLLNWKTFQEKASALLTQGKAGGLLVIDTDDFKSVNDTYGHLAGDIALQRTAAALVHAFRPLDLVGRLGGDEFAICINGAITDENLAKRCADMIEVGVEFPDQDGVMRTVTLSVGGVGLHGIATTYEDAYHQADKALYRAKAEGKKRFILEEHQAQ